jgi:hydrogenase-4 component F
MLLIALIALPLVAAGSALLLSDHRWRSALLPITGALHMGLALFLFIRPETPLAPLWLDLDPLSTLVLLVTGGLFFACALYALPYLRMRREWGNRLMVAGQLAFLSAVSLAVAARHLGLMWFAVEASTFISAPMIYFFRNPLSLEATWKYLINSAVSVALAMLGILFIAYARLSGEGHTDLHLAHLLEHGAQFDVSWLKAGFAFYTVGFATKMGLAPVHMWKPDAYGEAPGLVGALMSGALAAVAFLALLRGVQIMDVAGQAELTRAILVGFGLISIVIGAISMVRQPDIKRLLAYSSVKHMGILVLGVGIGGLAAYGAMLHLVCNAFAKSAAFLLSGNLQRSYGSKRLPDIQGALTHVPASGNLYLISFLALTGTPPFGLFISELLVFIGALQRHYIPAAVILLLSLGVAFVGFLQAVTRATTGQAPDARPAFRDHWLLVLPPALLLLLTLLLGITTPPPIAALLADAAALFEVLP